MTTRKKTAAQALSEYKAISGKAEQKYGEALNQIYKTCDSTINLAGSTLRAAVEPLYAKLDDAKAPFDEVYNKALHQAKEDREKATNRAYNKYLATVSRARNSYLRQVGRAADMKDVFELVDRALRLHVKALKAERGGRGSFQIEAVKQAHNTVRKVMRGIMSPELPTKQKLPYQY